MQSLRGRQEVRFFAALPHADAGLATLWYVLILLRGALPAGFAVAMGALIAAVQHKTGLAVPLMVAGLMFILLQILPPLHTAVSANLGDRAAAWLYDQLAWACTRLPGLGHLENPKLASDLSMARDFDLGITGPPLWVSMEFIAQGLIDLLSGAVLASILFAYRWWAGLILILAWLSTHWLLRESAVWFDRNTDAVRAAQKESDYAYRLAVTPDPAKEVRLFGLVDWTLEQFITRRRKLFEMQYTATRLRERSLGLSIVIVVTANIIVFLFLAHDAAAGSISLSQLIVFAQSALGASLIAFGGLNWALDGSAAPVAAVARLATAMSPTGQTPGYLVDFERQTSTRLKHAIEFRDVTFSYPSSAEPVLQNFTLTIPAGASVAIVGQNGAGKTTMAKLICRLYDPTAGTIACDGVDIRSLSLGTWRERIAAVFQDYIRFELSARENVAPNGAADDLIQDCLESAGVAFIPDLGLPLSKSYRGGIDLSGGQWQRIALARALCAVKRGAEIVILDEPTAQLDVRGEAEIFERLLAETRDCTTVLISHRFSTVRKVDFICVVENGGVVEYGSHQELMGSGGRYRTMYDLQARRFYEDFEYETGEAFDVLD